LKIFLVASIVSQLMKRYDRHVTYTHWEESAPNGVFLEGTGSLVIDRVNKVAYLLVSQRADEALFKQWCHRLGYTAVPFRANDSHGRTIYHTNVMMAIGTSVAVLCTESITDEKERAFVVAHLSKVCLKALSLPLYRSLTLLSRPMKLSTLHSIK
jgi:hypothetical protein